MYAAGSDGAPDPSREEKHAEKGIDSSIALILEGYEFISNRHLRRRADCFEDDSDSVRPPACG